MEMGIIIPSYPLTEKACFRLFRVWIGWYYNPQLVIRTYGRLVY